MTATITATQDEILYVPLEQIVDEDPTGVKDRSDVTELAASIKASGLHQPPLVRADPNGPGYRLVLGRRRMRAIRKLAKAGDWTGPVQVIYRDLDDVAATIVELVENIQRVDIDPMTEARTLFHLTELGVKQKDLAKKVGRSPKHVAARLALLALPVTAQDQVLRGEMNVGDAALLGELDADEVAAVLDIKGDSHGISDWDLNTAKRRVENARKVDAAIEAAVEAGAVVCDEREPQTTVDVGWKKVVTYSCGSRGLHLSEKSEKAHNASEPCRVLVVTERYQQVEAHWWCMDPGRHKPKGDSKIKEVRESNGPSVSKAEKARREAEAEAEAKQTAFFKGLATAALPSKAGERTAILEEFVDVVCNLPWYDYQIWPAVVGWLELPVAKGGAVDRNKQAVVEAVAKGGSGRLKVARASTLAARFGQPGRFWPNPLGGPGVDYEAFVAWMVERGYEPTDYDLGLVARQQARRQERDISEARGKELAAAGEADRQAQVKANGDAIAEFDATVDAYVAHTPLPDERIIEVTELWVTGMIGSLEELTAVLDTFKPAEADVAEVAAPKNLEGDPTSGDEDDFDREAFDMDQGLAYEGELPD